jgi:hypothetical protein
MDRYQAAPGFISHNPPVAYARPLSRKKLARLLTCEADGGFIGTGPRAR